MLSIKLKNLQNSKEWAGRVRKLLVKVKCTVRHFLARLRIIEHKKKLLGDDDDGIFYFDTQ